MPEFSSLNGYTVKDTTARNIAKGRNQAVAFSDYATMIAELNVMEKDQYKTGQNIYIGIVGVPDLWVYSVESVVHNFSYVSDDDVVEKLTANTTIQAGYYKLAMLEGQKVDLTTVNEQLTKHTEDITELNKNMGGCILSTESDGAYVTYTLDGETVKKKLGSLALSVAYTAKISAHAYNKTGSVTVNVNSYYKDYASLPSNWFGYISKLYACVQSSDPRIGGGDTSEIKFTPTYTPSTGKLKIAWDTDYSGNDTTKYWGVDIPIIIPA